jgi:hypothetical protein
MVDRIVPNLSSSALDLKLIDNGDGTYSLSTAIPGAATFLGVVGGKANTASGAVQRPDNTTQYTAGDVVNSDTPASLTFSNVARIEGGTGIVVDAILIDTANQATKGSFELWLFTAAPALDNDNAAFTPTDAELVFLAGVIQFSTAFVGTATVGTDGNAIFMAERTYLPISFECSPSGTSLYGVLVVRNAYTPIALETFTVLLKVIQD